jgi:hypothetical protein
VVLWESLLEIVGLLRRLVEICVLVVPVALRNLNRGNLLILRVTTPLNFGVSNIHIGSLFLVDQLIILLIEVSSPHIHVDRLDGLPILAVIAYPRQ